MTVDPQSLASFGEYLRFLRRRARLTQTELGIAVGYSPGQISMLENGQRHPDPTAVAALFLIALGIEQDRQRSQQLITLARVAVQQAHRQADAQPVEIVVEQTVLVERHEIGILEGIPAVPPYVVTRQGPFRQVQQWLRDERAVAICGLAGMGKSTLAAQIATRYSQDHPVFWATMVDTMSAAPETILRQLALFIAAHAADPARMAAFSRRPTAGEPAIPYAQQLALVAAALAELDAPLLVFDDAHQINGAAETLTLLQRLIARVPGCRMLFVTREEMALPGVFHLILGGIEREEATLLCDQLAQRSTFSVDQLLSQTGGSPILLRLAISHWDQQATSTEADRPLLTANYLVETILNRLDPSARRLLDLLAIWQGALDLTQPQLADLLDAQWDGYDHHLALTHLQRSRLIDQVTQALPHPLLREPLLTEIKARSSLRRQLHRLAADWAIQIDDLIRTAHHLAQAGDLQRACCLITQREAESYSWGEEITAAGVVDEILDLVQRQQRSDNATDWDESMRELLILRGDLLVNTTRTNAAQASYRQALTLTTRNVDRARLAEKMATSCYRQGELEEALFLCKQAASMLGVGLNEESIGLRMQIESTRLRVLITLARFDEARHICESALMAVRPVALILPKVADTVRAYANLALGYINRFKGDHQQASQYLSKAAKHAHAAGAVSAEGDALAYLSSTLRDLGDFEGSERTGQRALEIAYAAGNEYLISSILHLLSLADYYHNDLDRALWRAQRVLHLKQLMGDIEGIVSSRLVQSLVLSSQGKVDEAWACADQAVRDCALLENSWLRGVADFGVGVILSFTDDLSGAERHLLQALATDMLKLDIAFYAGAQIYLGMVYVALGRLTEAQRILDDPLPPGAGYSNELLRELVRGMWLLGQGNADAARACAEDLIRRARRYGFLIYAAEGNRLAEITVDPPSLAHLPRLVCCPGAAPLPLRMNL